MGMVSIEEKALALLRRTNKGQRPETWLGGGVLALLLLLLPGLIAGQGLNPLLPCLCILALVALKSGKTQAYGLAGLSALALGLGLRGDSAGLFGAFWNALSLAGVFFSFVFLLLELQGLLNKERDNRQIDELTGLMASGPFQELLAKEIERSRRFNLAFSVVGVGCDNLRGIESRLGPQAKDSLLRLLAEYLRATFRATDSIARLDEDEFVILLTGTADQSAILAMEKLRARLNEGITQHYPDATFSIGIVSFANCAYSAREVLDMADVACFQAKAGKVA